MNSKNKKLIIIGIILIIVLGIYLWNRYFTTNYNRDNISQTSCLNYPTKYNYAQDGMTCGPFSVAGTVRAITNEEVDSWEFAKSINMKIGKKGTHPIGLKDQLKENDVSIEVPKLKGYSNNERIEFLQERLSQCSAIILLGEPKGVNYEHYLTIVGFDKNKDIFYIYDSLEQKIDETHTLDFNGSLPGNKNMSSKELLEFWEGGGMYGFYEWFAIVGSEEKN